MEDDENGRGRISSVVIAEIGELPMARPLEDIVNSIAYDPAHRNDPAKEKDIVIGRCPVYAKGIVRQLAQTESLKFKKEAEVTRHIGVASMALLDDARIKRALDAISKVNAAFRRPRSAVDLKKSLVSGFHLLNEEDPDNDCAMSLHFVARSHDVLERMNYVKAVTGMDEKDVAIVLVYAFGATTRLLEVEMRRVAMREWINWLVYLQKRAGVINADATNEFYVRMACEQFNLVVP